MKNEKNISKCEEPKVEVDSLAVETVSKRLEPMYTVCDESDRPDNIVSCYPKIDTVVDALVVLIEVMLPGKFSPRPEETANLENFLNELLVEAWETLQPEIEKAIPFRWAGAGVPTAGVSPEIKKNGIDIHEETIKIMNSFLEVLPNIRKAIIEDIRANYNGDPAMLSYAEVKLASPGLMAMVSHRIAHELYKLEVPLIPRMMSEWTHTQTGIDIHPGATIDEGIFIDHGTGVVIGETAEIGKGVKIYQGVTLGAKSFPLDEQGNPVKHIKRHPTIEDNVVIYANAIILGGDTVIGKNSTIGGSVFLMKSVPENSFVAYQPPELKIKQTNGGSK